MTKEDKRDKIYLTRLYFKCIVYATKFTPRTRVILISIYSFIFLLFHLTILFNEIENSNYEKHFT